MRQALNVLVTMTLGGLWHGANWTFIVWGIFHGLGIASVHAIRDSASARFVDAVPRWIKVLFTFHFVLVGWVLFRAADILTMHNTRIDYGPGRHGITRGKTIYFFDPSGNRLETFGGYTAYQMDPDCRPITWTTDKISPAVFYYSQELNESFLSVYT